MRFRFAPLAVVFFSSLAARADSVIFTLSNPVQSITAAGGTLRFNASVFAPTTNTASEDLNALLINVNPANAFTIDQDPFLNSYPFSLLPGQSYSGLLFNLFVPAGALAKSYTGSVSLLGGPSNTNLGTQAFSVNVVSATAVTPEPSSFLLLGTGLVGIAATFRRRLTVSSTR